MSTFERVIIMGRILSEWKLEQNTFENKFKSSDKSGRRIHEFAKHLLEVHRTGCSTCSLPGSAGEGGGQRDRGTSAPVIVRKNSHISVKKGNTSTTSTQTECSMYGLQWDTLDIRLLGIGDEEKVSNETNVPLLTTSCDKDGESGRSLETPTLEVIKQEDDIDHIIRDLSGENRQADSTEGQLQVKMHTSLDANDDLLIRDVASLNKTSTRIASPLLKPGRECQEHNDVAITGHQSTSYKRHEEEEITTLHTKSGNHHLEMTGLDLQVKQELESEEECTEMDSLGLLFASEKKQEERAQEIQTPKMESDTGKISKKTAGPSKATPNGKCLQRSICNEAFTKITKLTHHMGNHHKSKKLLQCTFCEKSFPSRSQWVIHTRTHTGEKPFQCRVCGKRFSRKAAVDRHMVVHTGEKPHQCPVCNKSFTLASNMRQHLRTHTGEKPFPCAICGKRFRWEGDVNKHIKFHHGEGPYHCSLCSESFTRLDVMKTHMKAHNGDSNRVRL